MSARTLAIAMAAAMNTLGRAAVADGGRAMSRMLYGPPTPSSGCAWAPALWSRGKKAKAKRRRLLAARRGR